MPPILQAQEVTSLNEALVETRLNTLRAQDDASTQTLQAAYEETLVWLKQATVQKQVADAFVDSLTTEPQRAAEIQARLDLAAESDSMLPDVLADMPRVALVARLADLRSQLRDMTITRDVLDRQLTARETNARVARSRLSELYERGRELGDTSPSIEASAAPSALEASQWTLLAERMALEEERHALEAQLSSQTVRYRTRRLERAELSQRLDRLTEQVSVIDGRLTTDGESDFQSYPLNIDETEPEYTVAKEILASGINYQDQRRDLSVQLKTSIAQRDEMDRLTQRLTERFNTARRLVDFASDSEVLGNVLLVHWHELDTFVVPDPTGQALRQIGDTVISRIGHEEELVTLASASGHISNLIAEAGVDPESVQPEQRRELVELVHSGRAMLTQLIAVESNFIQALSELDAGFRQLESLTDEYRFYLGRLILWVPSHPSAIDLNLGGIPDEFADMAKSFSAPDDLVPSPVVLLTLLFASLLLMSASRFRAARSALNGRIVRARDDSIIYTIGVLLLTLLRALSLPALLVALSLWASDVGTVGMDAIANALILLALVSYALRVIAVSCEESGVGRVHFGWEKWLCDVCYREAHWLLRWWLPVAGVSVYLLDMEGSTIDAAAGRLMVFVALVMIAVRMYSGINFRTVADVDHAQSENRVRWALLMLVGVFLVLYFLGHVYSVNLVVIKIISTLWIGISLVLLQSTLRRWLRVAHRRLRLNELLAIRRGEDSDAGSHPEDEITLIELNTETSQLLNTAMTVVAVVALAYLWAPLLPVLNALDQVTLWSSSGVVDGVTVISQITLQTLTLVLFFGFVTFYAARRLPALMELVLRNRVAQSIRYTTSTLLSYLIISAGLITILATLGVKWNQIQWLVAALGVGVGFGLQEIVANFISGLIILFERPIRVGDVITVGENDGTVTRIRIRATTLRDWDGKELLVPNKEFVTGRLLNWTLSDPVTRITLDVGIAYGSDVEKALALLDKVIDQHEGVLEDPPPSIIFKGFGDNSLELSIRCFIESLDRRWQVITELHRSIYSTFGDAGIVIAFPQRDVHFDSDKPIRIAIDGKPDN